MSLLDFLPSSIHTTELQKRSALAATLHDAGVRWSSIGFIGNSLVIAVSFDARSDWVNDIFENSRGAKFIVHDDNRQLVHLTGWRVSKLRARKVKDFAHLRVVLGKWVLSNVASKEAQS